MNAFLQERISGMRIVQLFNAEQREADKFKKINHDYTGANLKSIMAYAIFFPVVDLISALSLGLMVWYGARGVLSEEVTLGAMVAFPMYINMLYRPIRMLADKFNNLQMGMIAAERVFGLLNKEQVAPNNGHLHPEKLNGAVSFENVSFSSF
jgi:ATP-binding cassette subfamily B protein